MKWIYTTIQLQMQSLIIACMEKLRSAKNSLTLLGGGVIESLKCVCCKKGDNELESCEKLTQRNVDRTLSVVSPVRPYPVRTRVGGGLDSLNVK